LENLYLSNALSRDYKGRIIKNSRSPFVDRIEKRLVKQMKREERERDMDYQMKLF
jgi:superfamily I DNA/RNA helicase